MTLDSWPRLALRAFAVGGSARVNILCDGVDHEADGANFWMVEKGIDRGFSAVDQNALRLLAIQFFSRSS